MDFTPDYYLGLLTSQYQGSGKLKDTLAALNEKVADADAALSQMHSVFDIDTATGDRLDKIGEIVGQNRTVDFQPTTGSPVLDDDTYRLLLKARIVANHWDGRVQSLYEAWSVLFPGGQIIVEDGQDMSATITMSGTFTSIIEDLINHGYIVPKPQGVRYTYGFGDLPFFGFDRDDAYISGLDTGHWT